MAGGGGLYAPNARRSAVFVVAQAAVGDAVPTGFTVKPRFTLPKVLQPSVKAKAARGRPCALVSVSGVCGDCGAPEAAPCPFTWLQWNGKLQGFAAKTAMFAPGQPAGTRK